MNSAGLLVLLRMKFCKVILGVYINSLFFMLTWTFLPDSYESSLFNLCFYEQCWKKFSDVCCFVSLISFSAEKYNQVIFLRV